jgi:cyanocobalamin reductase (cyanide-eliminating) / alkylcobalamin dealkylase
VVRSGVPGTILDWQRVHSAVTESCFRRGLDIVHGFGIDRQPSASSVLARLEAPDFERQRFLGLLIGNTRALWPAFQDALARDADLRAEPDPLDRYVVAVIDEARAKLSVRSVVRWAHVAEGQPLPIQRIAQEVGLAHLSPSHLSIHREHGPWIALRAVVLFDVDGPPPLPGPHDPCSTCQKPCLAALGAALAITSVESGELDVKRQWEAWLAVRDACPEGRGSRYGDEQIRYHYTKAQQWLGSERRQKAKE